MCVCVCVCVCVFISPFDTCVVVLFINAFLMYFIHFMVITL